MGSLRYVRASDDILRDDVEARRFYSREYLNAKIDRVLQECKDYGVDDGFLGLYSFILSLKEWA